MPFEWIPIVAQENPIRIHNGPVDLISIRDLGKELLREAKDDEEDGINHGMHHLMDDVTEKVLLIKHSIYFLSYFVPINKLKWSVGSIILSGRNLNSIFAYLPSFPYHK